MKLLITGANGQLGNEMRVLLQNYPNITTLFTDIDTLDITSHTAVDLFISTHRPDFLINCAAYTAVDKAEDDVALCHQINHDAVRILGEVASKYQVKMIHISTDYVFDGKNYKPYCENDAVCPTNVYGQSKLLGEQSLMRVAPQSIIIRTSWLYSSFGNNFVKTMLRLGREREQLGVIFDQVGTPTYAADLAGAIMAIVLSETFIAGIYHYSNEGVCSWYDFTIAIHNDAGIECHVLPIESSAYPVRTPRPHYSVLNKAKIKETFNISIPHWQNGMQRCLDLLEKN